MRRRWVTLFDVEVLHPTLRFCILHDAATLRFCMYSDAGECWVRAVGWRCIKSCWLCKKYGDVKLLLHLQLLHFTFYAVFRHMECEVAFLGTLEVLHVRNGT